MKDENIKDFIEIQNMLIRSSRIKSIEFNESEKFEDSYNIFIYYKYDGIAKENFIYNNKKSAIDDYNKLKKLLCINNGD